MISNTSSLAIEVSLENILELQPACESRHRWFFQSLNHFLMYVIEGTIFDILLNSLRRFKRFTWIWSIVWLGSGEVLLITICVLPRVHNSIMYSWCHLIKFFNYVVCYNPTLISSYLSSSTCYNQGFDFLWLALLAKLSDHLSLLIYKYGNSSEKAVCVAAMHTA